MQRRTVITIVRRDMWRRELPEISRCKIEAVYCQMTVDEARGSPACFLSAEDRKN
jgi:cobalamin biosynthesis protein CobD/CbiB